MFQQPQKNTELYDILGLVPDCSKEEIKKAYKKAAIKYHPDKLKSDATEEEKSMFVKIQSAYEILNDDEKRTNYDTYGIVDPNASPNINMDDLGGMSNLFDMLFRFQNNAQSPAQNIEPIYIEVELTLEEIIKGVKKTILFERKVLVNIETNKTASPNDIIFTCEGCKGTGSIVNMKQNGFMVIQNMQPCGKCKSTGYINLYPNKFTFAKKKCKFDYNFQKGVKNRENIVLHNLGNINPTKPNSNGDVVLVVRYNNTTSKFKTDPSGNLAYIQTISIFEAITGTEFEFSHPDGRSLFVKIPPIMPNFQKIVKKFGLPQNVNNEIIMTDLVILFEIIYPSITDDQKNLIKTNFEEFYHIVNKKNDTINLDFSNNL